MKRPLPLGFEQKLRAAFLAGATLRAAGRKAGISPATAYRWLHAHRDEMAPEIMAAAARAVPALRIIGIGFKGLSASRTRELNGRRYLDDEYILEILKLRDRRNASADLTEAGSISELVELKRLQLLLQREATKQERGES